jgi:hypothetical protein
MFDTIDGIDTYHADSYNHIESLRSSADRAVVF